LTRIPVSTYRFQFHRGFTFAQAAGLARYLADLGVTDVYASPIFKARTGSLHGYDVVDFKEINPEMGSEEAFVALSDELRHLDMGILLDIVPNHMCVLDSGNRWWMDVLENGPSSPYSKYYDIDWAPAKIDLVDKVLLPFLGDQYGRVLEEQGIRILFTEGGFSVRFYEHEFPVAPRTWRTLLLPALDLLRKNPSASPPDLEELESILTALDHLPLRNETAPLRVAERIREKQIVRRRINALHRSCEPFRQAVDEVLRDVNGSKGSPRSFDRLEALLADEAYRLCYWRVAGDEVNYRRFFDINELGAIRVEDPEVFTAVHELVLRLAREGRVTGLRVDHVDGLYDPLRYLRDLQAAIQPQEASTAVDLPFFVVVEKILNQKEALPPDWPVHGTTGYDFLNLVNGLFVDPSRAREFRDLYTRLTGRLDDLRILTATCKKLVMLVSMGAELHMLAIRLDRISEQHRSSRDFTMQSLLFALREVIAWFPAYRTYLHRDETQVNAQDRRFMEIAIREAKRHNPAVDGSVFDFVRQVCLLEHPDGLDEAQREERRGFVMRLQQYSGPVTAKGIEDTLFYRHFPLASLNEVGGDPSRFGVEIDEFHRLNSERLKSHPASLLTTSTHDTKRSEDVRARINVLSEIPLEWEQAVLRWRDLNRNQITVDDGEESPDANEEYLYYQTLVGTWPLEKDTPEQRIAYIGRLEEYLIKSGREAKLRTSWLNPDAGHESAVRSFVRSTLDPTRENSFVADFLRFLEPIRRAGVLNSLAQTLLKIASPGIPDFYQGSELWDFSLVDPDNRRPVDFERRRRLLGELKAPGVDTVRELLAAPADGRIKMYVTRHALHCRKEMKALFQEGDYVPLNDQGPQRLNLCAFARRRGDQAVIAAVGRRFLAKHGWGTGPGPQDALLLPGGLENSRWRDLFTAREVLAKGRSLDLADFMDVLPISLLVRIPGTK